MNAEQKPQVDELFGDDEIGMEGPPPSEPESGDGGRKGRGKLKIAIALLVLIGVAVFWFVSSAHHEQYYLVVEGDTVKVERGYFFPVGAGAWGTSNPAYTPFRLPEGVRPGKTGAMSLEEIDATLYDLYVDIARKNLGDFKTGDPDVAEEMLRRANKLSSSSVAADRKLMQMRGDVAFHRGLKEVRGIYTRFDMALEQFQEASRQGGLEFQDAQAWVDALERMRNDFRALSIKSNLDPDVVLADPATLAPPEGAVEPPADADAPPPPVDAPAARKAPKPKADAPAPPAGEE